MGSCISGLEEEVHSSPVEGSKTAGYSHIYRNSGHKKRAS